MSDTTTDSTASDTLRENWFWFFALGVLMTLGGALALYAPFEASLAVELIIGAFFLGGGILAIVQNFSLDDSWKARMLHLGIAILNTVAGALLLFRPLESLLALSLVVILNMFFGGCMRVYLGFQNKPEKGWAWLVTGGIISALTAIYLFTLYPGISLVLLGVFAGISLIVEGAGYIAFAFGLKRPAAGS